MQTKKFLIFLFIFLFMFGEVSEANQVPIANTFKQGIYAVSPEHEGNYRNIRLVTPNKSATVTILDSTNTQILFVKLNNINEYLKVGPIKKGETLIIGGEGEVSITH
ncbi:MULTISPECIES: hypothetical protein [Clostridium]|uniref:Uncharacterized protein n=1 Tax=Clostridium cibarium TaxID=2762247 RepID=A0ABR8PTD5_9CLOT|nr:MULTISPECIES: hypothetical protein [Clostridium]MBD7911432.1 hypothetical protein [Clostridium cibarium]